MSDNETSDYYIRSNAARLAVDAGAKPADLIKIASEVYTFLTAGNVSSPTSKPAASTAKPAKASAPASEGDAAEPSSDKPAASKTDAPKTTSPSNGFAEDGSEITLADVRAAAVKYVSANNEQALLDALGAFNAPNMSGLNPSDYSAFLEKISLPTASVFE